MTGGWTAVLLALAAGLAWVGHAYLLTTLLNAAYGRGENRYALRRALHLPEGTNPRALALSRSLREKHAGNDAALVDEVLS